MYRTVTAKLLLCAAVALVAREARAECFPRELLDDPKKMAEFAQSLPGCDERGLEFPAFNAYLEGERGFCCNGKWWGEEAGLQMEGECCYECYVDGGINVFDREKVPDEKQWLGHSNCYERSHLYEEIGREVFNDVMCGKGEESLVPSPWPHLFLKPQGEDFKADGLMAGTCYKDEAGDADVLMLEQRKACCGGVLYDFEALLRFRETIEDSVCDCLYCLRYGPEDGYEEPHYALYFGADYAYKQGEKPPGSAKQVWRWCENEEPTETNPPTKMPTTEPPTKVPTAQPTAATATGDAPTAMPSDVDSRSPSSDDSPNSGAGTNGGGSVPTGSVDNGDANDAVAGEEGVGSSLPALITDNWLLLAIAAAALCCCCCAGFLFLIRRKSAKKKNASGRGGGRASHRRSRAGTNSRGNSRRNLSRGVSRGRNGLAPNAGANLNPLSGSMVPQQRTYGTTSTMLQRNQAQAGTGTMEGIYAPASQHSTGANMNDFADMDMEMQGDYGPAFPTGGGEGGFAAPGPPQNHYVTVSDMGVQAPGKPSRV